MKVSNVFDIVGAAFLLAAIATVVAKPQIVSTSGSALSGVIRAATLR